MLDKSKEAFCMAIEIYNKPTIKYRLEGFSMFICNAWELMLKAHMINVFGDNSIYHKDHTERTLNLENCVKKVFTNNQDVLRQNLEEIIKLRNSSTHFITEEYEMIYIPLFQACVYNFIKKIQVFHSVDITQIMPEHFVNLGVSMKSFNHNEIIAKYPEEISSKLIAKSNELEMHPSINNPAFAISIMHRHIITKNPEEATSHVKLDNNAGALATIITQLKDPNDTHKYTRGACVELINSRLSKAGIVCRFTTNNWDLFVKYFGLKANLDFCYLHEISRRYCYSMQAIDFVVDEIRKDPNIIQTLKEKVKNVKEVDPRGKGF